MIENTTNVLQMLVLAISILMLIAGITYVIQSVMANRDIGKSIIILILPLVFYYISWNWLIPDNTKSSEDPAKTEKWRTVHVMELSAMTNASETHQSNGRDGANYGISEVNKIRFIQRHDDGSHTLDELPAYDMKIFEDIDAGIAEQLASGATREELDLMGDQIPRIEQIECRIHLDDKAVEGEKGQCGTRYEMHVPPGTINHEFTIDATN